MTTKEETPTRPLVSILAELADRQMWLITEMLKYLRHKGLFEDYCAWQANRNKERVKAP